MAGWLNAGLLGYTLTKRGHFQSDERLRRSLVVVIAASLAMGLVLIGADHLARDVFSSGQPLAVRSLMLAALVALGAIVFLAITYAAGVLRPAELKQALGRKG